ncbi:hypothetical protein QBC45DRAFT_383151 [Copromyces sp. CBS 386.78]|nr:hypothetical protein QBC45DRAFT_383151 [Copromyces sp. CBS 386.78]
MDKIPADLSLPISDAVTQPPLELPLLPSQSDTDDVEKDFHSSSLPHLGDFIARLLDDAHKLQSLNAEFERTKQQLREAEEKLASFEEPKSSLSTQLSKTKQQLRKAEAKIASTEKALRMEKDRNKDLEAHSKFLLQKWHGDQGYAMSMLDKRDEVRSKLRILENHANYLVTDLKRKSDALEQKDEAFQMKIHGYKALYRRLGVEVEESGAIIHQLTRYIFSAVQESLIDPSIMGEQQPDTPPHSDPSSPTPSAPMASLSMPSSSTPSFFHLSPYNPSSPMDYFSMMPSSPWLPCSSTPVPNQQLLPETSTQKAPVTSPNDSYWRRLFVETSADANALKIENNKLTAEINDLNAELEETDSYWRDSFIRKSADANAYKVQNNQLVAENIKLVAENNKLAAENNNLAAEKNKLAAEKNDLKAELAGFKRGLSKAKATIPMGEKKREQAAKWIQQTGEKIDTAKQKITPVENANTDGGLELYATRHLLQKASADIVSVRCARSALEKELEEMKLAQAAIKQELKDTKNKVLRAVREKRASDVDKTLLNSSLAQVKMALFRANATLSTCVAERDALKRLLSDPCATAQPAVVSQVFDKIAAVHQDIDRRLSAFEEALKRRLAELQKRAESKGEQVPEEKPEPESSKAEASTGAGGVSQGIDADTDTDAAILRGKSDVSYLVGDYLIYIVERMVKEEKNIYDAVSLFKVQVINYQDWLFKVYWTMGDAISILGALTDEGIKRQCQDRCIKFLWKVVDEYYAVKVLVKECYKRVDANEAELDLSRF